MCLLIYTPTHACGCAAPRESKLSIFFCPRYVAPLHYEQEPGLGYTVCVNERLVPQLILPFVCERHDRESIIDDGETERRFIREAMLFNHAKIVEFARLIVEEDAKSLLSQAFDSAAIIMETVRQLGNELLHFSPTSMYYMSREQNPVVDRADAVARWALHFPPAIAYSSITQTLLPTPEEHDEAQSAAWHRILGLNRDSEPPAGTSRNEWIRLQYYLPVERQDIPDIPTPSPTRSTASSTDELDIIYLRSQRGRFSHPPDPHWRARWDRLYLPLRPSGRSRPPPPQPESSSTSLERPATPALSTDVPASPSAAEPSETTLPQPQPQPQPVEWAADPSESSDEEWAARQLASCLEMWGLQR